MHTVGAVCYDSQKKITMVVIPDDDSQLDDPAYNPEGVSQLRLPIGTIMDSALFAQALIDAGLAPIVIPVALIEEDEWRRNQTPPGNLS